MKQIKRIYGIFFTLFIIVGLGMAIFGFVRLAQYKGAKEVDATVLSVDCFYDERVMRVEVDFQSNGKRYLTSFFTDLEYKDGRLTYYEGLQTKVLINSKKQIATYGKTDILVTVGGVAFLSAGVFFLHFFVLKKRTFFDIAYDYEKAMVSPDDLSDETAKYEAKADELSKLPEYDPKRMVGEGKVWGNRILDRLKSFTVAQNIILNLILLGLIVLFWTVFKMGVFGIFCGMFTFAFGGLFLKFIYNMYVKSLVKFGKFSEKKLARVKICVFESEGRFQMGDLSRDHIVFKKFRVVATIDGKRSVGYIVGNVPPPKGCILKVLVRPRRIGRFIIDNT